MSDDNGKSKAKSSKPIEEVPSAVIFFAGDSGDGMQLVGTQFTDTSAIFGNDVATMPDYPSEIRAPAGTVPGVSGFQINFASNDIHTPGDEVNVLFAMNPAALKAYAKHVVSGGIIIVNESEFNKVNLRKAGYAEGDNPLDDPQLNQQYKLMRVPITKLNSETLADSGMNGKSTSRCKNMFALGLVYWLYDRPVDQTVKYLDEYFGKKKNLPDVAKANIKTLKAGYFFGETTELFAVRYHVAKAPVTPGKYRKITGNEAAAIGLTAAAKLAGKTLVYCSYPITPASDILHHLATMRNFGVKTFQAEDEIAAMCAAIGASFAGQIGVTGTSGPGVALKSEAMGLAVITELPVVIFSVQRGGPSTGLPTKTEQSDLFQAMYGRNGDCPMVVMAPQSPADCFDIAIEATRIALKYMTPVIILSDGYLANGAEPWLIPNPESLDKIETKQITEAEAGNYQIYGRDEDLARPWAIPGTPGLEHRIGGLEKEDGGGAVSYDPDNHQIMTEIRERKIEKVKDIIPAIETHGDRSGEILVVGWGGTYGSIVTAVNHLRDEGKSVSSIHLRHLNPMPANIGDVLKRFDKILVPELNNGQLRLILRGKHLVDARGLNKIKGRSFLIEEIVTGVNLLLNDTWGENESILANHTTHA